MIFSIIAIPVLIIFVTLISLVAPKRYVMKRFRRAISWYGKGMVLVPFPFIRVRYEDHSKGSLQGPYIFVSNHRSASDAFLMSVLPHEAIQVVNIWPFRIPVLGFFARFAGYLNIRMMDHELFLEKAAKVLEDKVSIIFFPEGTRSTGREMGSFHGSAFRLALQTNASLVPICITGNENTPPKGSWLMRPVTIKIRRLPAIQPQDYKGANVFTLKNRVREIMRQELASMEGAA
ncbi:MAG: 1-acyl-sn-glycerol-3-phosphate acyltransferase [Nitrospirae bacterium]|nr:1-acyl-sn-glycerol-3-phosphate acyltransferase [Nitrospirota bacterium]